MFQRSFILLNYDPFMVPNDGETCFACKWGMGDVSDDTVHRRSHTFGVRYRRIEARKSREKGASRAAPFLGPSFLPEMNTVHTLKLAKELPKWKEERSCRRQLEYAETLSCMPGKESLIFRTSTEGVS